MDVLTPEQRHRNMASIKGWDTKPEKFIRSVVHGLGYRFRLHNNKLAGKPDIVLKSGRKVIFVHGCFWHMHRCRFGKVKPKTNAEFWEIKRTENRDRDKRVARILKKDEWQILTVWECQTRTPDKLKKTLTQFLAR